MGSASARSCNVVKSLCYIYIHTHTHILKHVIINRIFVLSEAKTANVISSLMLVKVMVCSAAIRLDQILSRVFLEYWLALVSLQSTYHPCNNSQPLALSIAFKPPSRAPCKATLMYAFTRGVIVITVLSTL